MDTSNGNTRMACFKIEMLKNIQAGSLLLRPLDASLACDYNFVSLTQSMCEFDDEINKYLPKIDSESPEATMKFLMSLVARTEMGIGFAYVIYVERYPAGLIMFDTPTLNARSMGIGIWSVDFLTFSPFRKHGIVTAAILRMLDFFQRSIGEEDIHFIVDSNNTACLSVMGKLPVEEISNIGFSSTDGGLAPRVFVARLSQLSFQ